MQGELQPRRQQVLHRTLVLFVLLSVRTNIPAVQAGARATLDAHLQRQRRRSPPPLAAAATARAGLRADGSGMPADELLSLPALPLSALAAAVVLQYLQTCRRPGGHAVPETGTGSLGVRTAANEPSNTSSTSSTRLLYYHDDSRTPSDSESSDERRLQVPCRGGDDAPS